jgi:predicted 2-oxoglutarate/Fe(II)-dependent dioxygenase YbiX
MKVLWPDEYSRLEKEGFADSLPGNMISPVHPHAGFAINLNVATICHRDEKDDGSCTLVPFGEFDGGEIVLEEVGLIIKLRPGDILYFRSTDLTHYNLDYKGRRGSLVIHTDVQGRVWKARRNGLSQFLRTTQ